MHTSCVNNTHSIVDIIESNCHRFHKKDAIIYNECTLTYKDIKTISDRISQYLQKFSKSKTKSSSPIGLCLSRTQYLPAVIFGIFKSCSVYVPLDPIFPKDRLQQIIDHSDMKIILTDNASIGTLPKVNIPIILIEDILNLKEENNLKSNETKIAVDSVAYLMYTSGSTGTPKGVQISHESLLNLHHAFLEKKIITEKDKILSLTTIAFDISILELILPLAVGGQIVITNKENLYYPQQLTDLIIQHQITILQMTPSSWEILWMQKWRPDSKLFNPHFQILCGGEPLTQTLAERLCQISSAVYNVYGPTETTVWSTIKKINPKEPITAGLPLRETYLEIVNEEKIVLPDQEEGILSIGGAGVSKGYYKSPQLNNDKFYTRKKNNKEIRFFYTGDRARWITNSKNEKEVVILGRVDRQIKIQGYRIELSEIQNEIEKLNLFKRIHVFATDEKIVIAAIPSEHQKKSYSQNQQLEYLKQKLKSKLPHYMLPHGLISVPEFALTLNLKIDEKKLIQIYKQQQDQSISSIEDIFKKHLNTNSFSLEKSFLDSGGDSIRAVNITVDIENYFKQSIPLSVFAENLTNEEILKKIRTVLHDNELKRTSHLVNLRTQSNQNEFKSNFPIIIFFHAVGGQILNYSQMLNKIPNNFQILAFQSYKNENLMNTSENLIQRIQDYLKELPAYVRRQPLILAGGSMGGVLAYEAAQQLKTMNYNIEKVVMFDTEIPTFTFYEKLIIFLKTWKKRIQLKTMLKEKKLIDNQVINDWMTFHNYKTLLDYRPKKFIGDIHLIRISSSDRGLYKIPSLGWNKFVDGKIHIYEIPNATHDNLIENENFQEKFKDILTEKTKLVLISTAISQKDKK